MADFFSTDGLFNTSLTAVNDVLWTYLLIGALIACGLWFTLRTGFVQFRMFGEMIRLLKEEGAQIGTSTKRHISPFKAFCISLASRVGTGNLAGVATAIAVGGPGAVFWMWVIALVGAATAFVESTLAQLFKQRSTDSFIGGPAYYIRKGLGSRWMAATIAVLMTMSFGLANNSVQANTICGAINDICGVSPMVMGGLLAMMTLFVAFGGVQRVAHVSSIIVPIMAVGYLILAIVVIAMNWRLVPDVMTLIVENAFGVNQAIGGTIGAAMMNGVKRGLFSNEAGEGSAPNAAATATTSHPVKQGLIQSLGVFTDTLVVCSCTAFIILLSGLYNSPELNGINLTQAALRQEVGSIGPVFVAIAIFLFAFSSMVGNYYYGEANVRYLTQSKAVMTTYRILSGGVFVLFGAAVTLEVVWNVIDLFMALLTACNLAAICVLGKYVFRLVADYRQQRRNGIRSPEYHRSTIPELYDVTECWPD